MNETAQTLFHIRVTPSIGSIERVPFSGRSDQGRARAIEHQLGRRHLARAELVLEPVDADAVQPAVGVAHLDVEHREALAARRIALGPRERERHLRGDGRREPLAAVQAPAALVVRYRPRLGAADVGAAGGLGHPLAAGPERRGVARGEARQRAIDQRLVAGVQQAARRAVRHRQRAGVDVRRRVEQVDLEELRDARVATHRRLVTGRDQAVLGGEALGLAPQRRDLDFVDALAPGIPLREHRLVGEIGLLQPVQVAAGERAELAQLAAQLRHDRRGQRALDPRTQQRIVVELVAEARRRLREERVRPVLILHREAPQARRPARVNSSQPSAVRVAGHRRPRRVRVRPACGAGTAGSSPPTGRSAAAPRLPRSSR